MFSEKKTPLFLASFLYKNVDENSTEKCGLAVEKVKELQ